MGVQQNFHAKLVLPHKVYNQKIQMESNMKKQGFDTNGGDVQIDLNFLLRNAIQHMQSARGDVERCQRSISDALERAAMAQYDKSASAETKRQNEYLGLCNANSGREYLTRAVDSYNNAVEAVFYLTEAIKRDGTVTIIK
jgi:hypothetical protein